ncbi:mitochondrial nicotinamide adenine dinucleotide transporter SLC25A51 [Hydra vulgaris]|uniref:mitochondrial nicotinamide adenine dinucleotide transporter SLC25A51 n=1 Tax=Hydra vulgaris TaxID=6087 RepID=UPI001F5F3D69|nr:mitochondrial nicotinamide adenine dinucleotide transporter SLC25A51 [Hydra vulgaris]
MLDHKNHSGWHEFAAGAGASFINLACTFPAHKAMLRQQVDSITLYRAVNQLKQEGIFKLYRGFAPPLIQKCAGLSLMFGSYHAFEKMFSENFPSYSSLTIKIAAALLAGSIEALLAPLERMQTLLSISEHKDYVYVRNTLHTFLKIKKHYNWKEYYRGFTPILLRNGPSTAVFFVCRESIKQSFPTPHNSIENVVEDFLSGALLGACNSTLFYPLNVVKVNMQKRLGEEYKSIVVTIQEIYRLRGGSIQNLYFGVHLNFSRALVSWGIINVSYEYIMKVLSRTDK